MSILDSIEYTIQSVIIPKKYNLIDANVKVINLGYNNLYKNKHVNEYKSGQTPNYYIFKQLSTTRFIKNSFRKKTLDNGIFLIFGELK